MLTVWMYCSEESSGLCSRGRGAVAAAEHRGVGGQSLAVARACLAAPARAVEQTTGIIPIGFERLHTLFYFWEHLRLFKVQKYHVNQKSPLINKCLVIVIFRQTSHTSVPLK